MVTTTKNKTAREALLRQITEKQFMDQVIQAASLYHWIYFHDQDSRKNNPGWPDLFLAKIGRGAHFWECKTETGRVRPEQQYWIDHLNQSGIKAAVIRPRDWDKIIGVLSGEGEWDWPL